jgi:hypothetical protein
MAHRNEFRNDPAVRPADKFKEVRDLWLVEEQESPFATFRYLRNCGVLVAKECGANLAWIIGPTL